MVCGGVCLWLCRSRVLTCVILVIYYFIYVLYAFTWKREKRRSKCLPTLTAVYSAVCKVNNSMRAAFGSEADGRSHVCFDSIATIWCCDVFESRDRPLVGFSRSFVRCAPFGCRTIFVNMMLILIDLTSIVSEPRAPAAAGVCTVSNRSRSRWNVSLLVGNALRAMIQSEPLLMRAPSLAPAAAWSAASAHSGRDRAPPNGDRIRNVNIYHT